MTVIPDVLPEAALPEFVAAGEALTDMLRAGADDWRSLVGGSTWNVSCIVRAGLLMPPTWKNNQLSAAARWGPLVGRKRPNFSARCMSTAPDSKMHRPASRSAGILALGLTCRNVGLCCAPAPMSTQCSW